MSRGEHGGLEKAMRLYLETQQSQVQLPGCPRTSCRIFNFIFSLSPFVECLCVFNWEMFSISLYGIPRGLTSTGSSGKL